MFNGIHNLTGKFLLWIIDITNYHTGIFIKDTIGNVLCGILGGVIGMLVIVLVVKDNRVIIDDKSERIFITKIKKKNHTRIFTTLPPDKGNQLTVILTITILFNLLLIKIFPIKQIQFVSHSKIYICFWSILILTVIFIIFSISVDYHLILPTKDGGYYVKY